MHPPTEKNVSRPFPALLMICASHLLEFSCSPIHILSDRLSRKFQEFANLGVGLGRLAIKSVPSRHHEELSSVEAIESQ